MIRVLPADIATLIAAGEVVDRPASAIKELMENSIDAGADEIYVNVTDAGRTAFQVIDNGCGMSIEDAKLCFVRHATSKIETAEDLEKILTYGFRGEALASIAAVADVTLKTRREDDEVGVEVSAAESQIKGCTPVSTPKGCNIEVRNLFYNVPARRKFLKSDAAEFRAIMQEFQRVAIINTNVSFTLVHNGKIIHSVQRTDLFKKRVCDLCGQQMEKSLVDINTDTSVVSLRGFIGAPQEARKTLGNQYMFVNGRFFRSPYLHKAVCNPYQQLVKEGMTPSYFLKLEIDPTRVDVNIDPHKYEVKFEDDSIIFEIVSACVREALGRGNFAPSIDFASGELIDFPINTQRSSGGSLGHGGYVAPPKVNYDPLFNPFDFSPSSDGMAAEDLTYTREKSRFLNDDDHDYDHDHDDDHDYDYDDDHDYDYDHGNRLLKAEGLLLVAGGRFVARSAAGGIQIIDVRRARECIYYEKYFGLLVEKCPISMQPLFPLQLEFDKNTHQCLTENISLLERIGFDIRDFGGTTIVVYAHPDLFPSSEDALRGSLDSIAAAICNGTLSEDEPFKEAVTLAQNAAKYAPLPTSSEEAQLLVKELSGCRHKDTTPDGKLCSTLITQKEIESRL